MEHQSTPRKFSRRDFLKLGGLGALLLAGGGTLPAVLRKPARRAVAAPASAAPGARLAVPPPLYRRLVATDGFIVLPGRDPLYVFGFTDVTDPDLNSDINTLDIYKGRVQAPAPILATEQDQDVYITLTNIGLVGRPDLDDSHTIHWHGFRNPIALFDGVPEVSISVPPARNFPYFYRPHDPGTYMYHCHFEDTEHVQMGMTGIVYVNPAQNGTPITYNGKTYTRFVYNDGDGSTGYERQFTLLLNEVDTRPHDNLLAVQEFIWSDYDPNYFVINGRAYPDTIKLSNDPSLEIEGTVRQSISSLIQVNPYDQVLLRFVNLGYRQHAMQLNGIPMRVVGEDATLLRGPDGFDLSYWTNTIYIGSGEARDVIFTAPGFASEAPGGTDAWGAYNSYLLMDRNLEFLTNNGLPGLGGMVTEVRVYTDPLPAQSAPNETYP